MKQSTSLHFTSLHLCTHEVKRNHSTWQVQITTILRHGLTLESSKPAYFRTASAHSSHLTQKQVVRHKAEPAQTIYKPLLAALLYRGWWRRAIRSNQPRKSLVKTGLRSRERTTSIAIQRLVTAPALQYCYALKNLCIFVCLKPNVDSAVWWEDNDPWPFCIYLVYVVTILTL